VSGKIYINALGALGIREYRKDRQGGKERKDDFPEENYFLEHAAGLYIIWPGSVKN
jgi:hypothetical protein